MSINFLKFTLIRKKKNFLVLTVIFLNDQNIKINSKNKPRIFANSIKLNNEKNVFNKSVFTLCDYRPNDKCPPWTIQSSKMLHDNKKDNLL